MTEKIGYIARGQRKKILFISDSIIGVSGVSNVARSIIAGTAHHYNYVNIGVSLDKSRKGQRYDLCKATNEEAGIEDSNVVAVAWDVYDDIEMIKQVISAEKVDALVFITDPRYFQRLFEAAHEIQHNGVNGHKPIPMCYLSIWDELIPPFYNRSAWSSVNLSLCISKQTLLMNEIVLGDRVDKTNLSYFPHGVDIKRFRPLENGNEDVIKLREKLFNGVDYEFVLFFNSRNIQRKNIPTALLAFKAFLKKLPTEDAKKCCFLLHTQPVDNNGTDLYAVRDTLFGPDKNQIIFDEAICSQEDLNLRYNLSDATVIVSEAEGFGLSGLESIASGTSIIANITGGVQDYCNFTDEEGNWFSPSHKVWSNHNGTNKSSHGEWVFPVWPSALTLVGSVPTPYIFSSRCDFKDVADQMFNVYKIERKLNKENGKKGREWIQKEEVGMTTDAMCNRFIKIIDETLENWEPIDAYSIISIDGTETLNYTEIPDYLFERN